MTLASVDSFRSRRVVVTEKMDGENTTLYRDGTHARSINSGHHPSRSWVKSLQARIGHFLPEGLRVCGENLFARHSIAYEDLPSYFLVFSVWEGNLCLSWDQTCEWARRLGLRTVPEMSSGTFDEVALRRLKPRREGYVVRWADAFERENFEEAVAKWVRPNHVTTSQHWMQGPLIRNGLAP